MYVFSHKSVLTALIIAVLAIGGCLPCQQLFAGQQSKKSCCNSKGECKRQSPNDPAKKTCNLQTTDIQSRPQQQADNLASSSLGYAVEPVFAFAPLAYPAVQLRDTIHIDSSPPALFLLNLCLLI